MKISKISLHVSTLFRDWTSYGFTMNWFFIDSCFHIDNHNIFSSISDYNIDFIAKNLIFKVNIFPDHWVLPNILITSASLTIRSDWLDNRQLSQVNKNVFYSLSTGSEAFNLTEWSVHRRLSKSFKYHLYNSYIHLYIYIFI